MKKNAVVIRCDGSGYAEVRVKRESACSHACESCGGGCAAEIIAKASNPLGARPGDRVSVGSSTKKVMSAALVVYGLPALLMLLTAVVCACSGMRELLTALLSFAALAAGCVVSVFYGRKQKNAPEFTIIEIE